MYSGKASIDQLDIVLTTESVKGVSKGHQNAVIEEAEKTYRLANVRLSSSIYPPVCQCVDEFPATNRHTSLDPTCVDITSARCHSPTIAIVYDKATLRSSRSGSY